MIREALTALAIVAVLVAGCSDSSRSHAPDSTSSVSSRAAWQQPGAGVATFSARPGPGDTRVWWPDGALRIWGRSAPTWAPAVNAALSSTISPVTSEGLADLAPGWEVAFVPQSGLYLGPQAPLCSAYVDSQRKLIVLAYRSNTVATAWRGGGLIFPGLAPALTLATQGLDGAVQTGLFPGSTVEGAVVQVPAPQGWTADCPTHTRTTAYGSYSLPAFVYEHADWTPAREAELVAEIDLRPNEKGSKTLASRPGLRVFYAGPGGFVDNVQYPVNGIIAGSAARCSWGGGKGPTPAELSPVYNHELAHWFGWAGSHPSSCPSCQVSSP